MRHGSADPFSRTGNRGGERDAVLFLSGPGRQQANWIVEDQDGDHIAPSCKACMRHHIEEIGASFRDSAILMFLAGIVRERLTGCVVLRAWRAVGR